MFTILDTETTGFPKNGALKQDGQARVAQIAAILCQDDGTHVAEFCTLIKPDGWTMSEGAQRVHGISQEQCQRFGMKQLTAMEVVSCFINNSKVVVAHNAKFDLQMLEIEFHYAGLSMPEFNPYCTMLASVPLCRLPGNYGQFKWPKLAEALPIICGRELGDGAHDAMVDTLGAKDIFFELIKRGVFKIPGKEAA